MGDDLVCEAPGGIGMTEPLSVSIQEPWHQPVMAEEVLQHLRPRPGGIVVDGTVGTGGHSLWILPKLLPDGRLIALDRDPQALRLAQQRLREFAPLVTFVHEDYRRLPAVLERLGIPRVDGLVLDLGMSSLQVDRPERGFSFSAEGPLDMRMNPDDETTAATLVNRLSLRELTDLFVRFGEERFAGRIARRIVEARRRQPLSTTAELAGLVRAAVPPPARHGRIHPATRVFQALRIAVNDELGALEDLLAALPIRLAPGGRAVILSYHSLEDRLVKRAFAAGAREGHWIALTKKPVTPSSDERLRNPRGRSAKLRAVEGRGPS